MNHIIQQIEAERATRKVPDFKPGDTIVVNVKVKEKCDLAGLPDIQRAIEAGEQRLNGTGRILVRYSGTEPVLRIMVEGEQDLMIREVADHLVQTVRARLG